MPNAPTAVKGMRDLLPPESDWFGEVEAAARAVFALHGYQEIRTPILERTELFTRTVGEETDIVGKEMYTFLDRDQTSLTLRPEATAAVARAFAEHRLWERPGWTRLYYIGPMFRRERPQQGRYRQFWQIGAELLGGDAPQMDYELLAMLVRLLEKLGLSGWTLHLNSLGCAADRQRFEAALRAALQPLAPRLCADCRRRAETHPLRVLDCKREEDQPLIAQLPTPLDFLDDACREHFAALRALLDAGGIPYQLQPRLVRGLDYYSRTAFEFVHGTLGAQNALLGGGRYDLLAERLGAPAGAGAGIGFALGEDRLVSAWRAGRPAAEAAAAFAVYVAPLGLPALAPALALAERLRQAGHSAVVGDARLNLKKHLSTAGRRSARWAVLLGEAELAARRLAVKALATGEQSSVGWDELESYFASAAAAPPAADAAAGQAGGRMLIP